jgi:hypothetical protein
MLGATFDPFLVAAFLPAVLHGEKRVWSTGRSHHCSSPTCSA